MASNKYSRSRSLVNMVLDANKQDEAKNLLVEQSFQQARMDLFDEQKQAERQEITSDNFHTETNNYVEQSFQQQWMDLFDEQKQQEFQEISCDNFHSKTNISDSSLKQSKRTRNSVLIVDYSSSSEDIFSDDDTDHDPLYHIPQDILISDSDSPDEQPMLSRWKKSQPEKWQVNIAKKRRSQCLPYQNKTKLCPAKIPKSVNCSTCRFKCNENFTEDDRKIICDSYWGLNDYNRPKDFLLNHIKSEEPKRKKVDPSSLTARNVSKSYYLNNSRGKFRVCAVFFEKTLCISNGPIITALSGRSVHTNCFDKPDLRGKKAPGNKTSEAAIIAVKDHIKSFPVVEAHYVRQSSKRKYLDANLNVKKMYSLYLQDRAEKNVVLVKEPIYRKIFGNDFNYSFFLPKKDQCCTCNKYKLADVTKKQNLEVEFTLHLLRKEECSKAKKTDKNRAANDPTFQTATFDLESVLQLPYSAVSIFYYLRKLCVYNLTFYEGDGLNCYCYAWNEVNGKRGSNEIGSLIWKYIQTLPEEVKHLSLFSDTCGGQNRNQQVAALLLYASQNTQLDIIELKFLESGHTYMECDSMHSAIESARKHKSLYLMNDWLNIFKSARSTRGKNKDKPPYHVAEIKYKDFYDLQSLAKTIIKNRNVDENGDKVSWLKVKCLRFEKLNHDIIFYRYDHISEYKKIFIGGRTRLNSNLAINTQLTPVYNNLLPISIQKKNDLLKMCNDGHVPDELHKWYEGLPTSANMPSNDVVQYEDEDDSVSYY